MKSLLESIDRIGHVPSAPTVENKSTNEELLLKEWEDFKNSYTVKEEQLDEIAPALAALGGLVARGAATAGSALARGAASAVGSAARGVANAAKAAVPVAANIAKTAGQGLARQAVKTAATNLTSGSSTAQQQPQTTADPEKEAGEKIATDTAANIQKIKSSTGANINVPGVTQSVLKAAAGQQMNPGDTKNLSTLMDPLTKTLADPAKAKKLSDILKMP